MGPGGSVYSVNSRCEKVNASGRSYLFANGMRLAMVDGNGAQFLHSDQLGSANVSTDELGQIISGTEYTPFGVVRSKFGNKVCAYGFTDQEYDAGTGLYNYDARLYDPVLAIFIMADTLIPDILNPQSFNRYAYALNRPLVFVDPSGHISINAIKIIAGVAQITLGGIACWTGVGCSAGLFAIANGIDDIYSGVRGLQKGDSNATGFIEDFGNVVGEGVGLGPGVGSGGAFALES